MFSTKRFNISARSFALRNLRYPSSRLGRCWGNLWVHRCFHRCFHWWRWGKLREERVNDRVYGRRTQWWSGGPKAWMLWQEVKGMQKAHWMKYADFNKLLCECSLAGQSTNIISTLEKKDLWKRIVQLQCPQTHTNVIRLIICIQISHAPSVSMWCWTSIPLLNLHSPLLPGDVKVLMSPQLTATKSRLSRIGPCQSWTAWSSMVSHLSNLWVGVWVQKVLHDFVALNHGELWNLL